MTTGFMRVTVYVLATSILIMLLIVLWFVGPQVYTTLTLDRRIPVIEFDRLEVIGGPVNVGDALIVRAWRTKVRDDCPVTATRHAVSTDGVIYNIPPGVWRGGSADAGFVDLAYLLPDGMPAGEYELRGTVVYACPGGLLFNVPVPETPFHIQ